MFSDDGQPRYGPANRAALARRAQLRPEPGGPAGKLGSDLRAVRAVPRDRYLPVCVVPRARTDATGGTGPSIPALHLAEPTGWSGRTGDGGDSGRSHVEPQRCTEFAGFHYGAGPLEAPSERKQAGRWRQRCHLARPLALCHGGLGDLVDGGGAARAAVGKRLAGGAVDRVHRVRIAAGSVSAGLVHAAGRRNRRDVRDVGGTGSSAVCALRNADRVHLVRNDRRERHLRDGGAGLADYKGASPWRLIRILTRRGALPGALPNRSVRWGCRLLCRW